MPGLILGTLSAAGLRAPGSWQAGLAPSAWQCRLGMGLSQQHALTWLEGLPQGMSAMQASEKRQGSADWADKQLWEPWLSMCIPVAVEPHNRHTISPFLNIFAVLDFFFFCWQLMYFRHR